MTSKHSTEKQLYQICFSKFFGVAMRYCKSRNDALEVFNDSMIKVINNYHSGKIIEDKFDPWCKKVIVNTAIDFLRKKRFDTIEFDYASDYLLGSEGNSGEQNLIANELLYALKDLPAKTRAVFNLYAFEGYSHKEISEELDISEGTSHWHVNNARNILKSILESTKLIAL